MSGKLIAVDNGNIKIDNASVSATLNLNKVKAEKGKVSGSSILLQGTQGIVTNITSNGATIPDIGPYTLTIKSTVKKVKAERKLVLLEGDQSDKVTATPQIPENPPTNYPVTFKLVIQSAGQTKVRAV